MALSVAVAAGVAVAVPLMAAADAMEEAATTDMRYRARLLTSTCRHLATLLFHISVGPESFQRARS